MPTPVEVKQCLVYTDLAMKMEIIIFDLSTSLWWSSMAEFLIFFFALSLFLIDPAGLGSIWLFLPHISKGLVGMVILKKMPTTHEMV